MNPRFEIRAWSYIEETEEVAEWTVLDNGKDTMIVDDSREALQRAIDDGTINSMIEDIDNT